MFSLLFFSFLVVLLLTGSSNSESIKLVTALLVFSSSSFSVDLLYLFSFVALLLFSAWILFFIDDLFFEFLGTDFAFNFDLLFGKKIFFEFFIELYMLKIFILFLLLEYSVLIIYDIFIAN